MEIGKEQIRVTKSLKVDVSNRDSRYFVPQYWNDEVL